jgi:hypothetical protein
MNETCETNETAKIVENNEEIHNNVMQMGVPGGDSREAGTSESVSREIQVTEEQMLGLRQNKEVDELFTSFEKAQEQITWILLKIKNEKELSGMAALISEKINLGAILTSGGGKCPAGTTFNPITGFCE